MGRRNRKALIGHFYLLNKIIDRFSIYMKLELRLNFPNQINTVYNYLVNIYLFKCNPNGQARETILTE